MGVGTEPIPIGCSAIKPIERHGWEAVSWFLYDRNTGAFMGRTPKSWALITIFYIIYYTCLAGFWAVMLFVFFQFIDKDQPYWQQDNSRIGRSPALGVRPKQVDKLIDSSIIMFNMGQPKNDEDDPKKVPGWYGWADRTTKYLESYKNDKKNNKGELTGIDCETEARNLNDLDQFCLFKKATLGVCDGQGEHDVNFGYESGNPCILLKLNKIYGLVPDWYNSTESIEKAPPEKVKDMPQEVKDRVRDATDKNKVWISCKGENAADREGMGTITMYPPDGGIPEQYFPYTNQKNYQSPLVAIKFNNPNPGQFIHIECRAWAKNIGYNRRDRAGIAHFELMIHDAASAKHVDWGTYPEKDPK